MHIVEDEKFEGNEIKTTPTTTKTDKIKSAKKKWKSNVKYWYKKMHIECKWDSKIAFSVIW